MTRLPLILFVINVTLVIVCFFPSMPNLWAAWQTDEYSHGPLIPLLAIMIGWHRLVEKKPIIRPNGMGLAVLFFGFSLFILSRLSAFEPLAHYGFLIAVTGLSLTTFGNRFTAALSPAFIYLFFAIPLPRLIYVALSADLQLISSTLGVLPLQWLGISVFQEGNIIDLGGYKLQVVEACNGLRYLFPLMSFGFLMAFMLEDKMWKRATLFLSTIPITIGMNALRIAIIGITVDRWGGEMATGLLHDFEGWTLFSICIVILAIETWLLMHIGTKGRFRFDTIGLAHGSIKTGSLTLQKQNIATFALCLMFTVFLRTGILEDRDEIVPPHLPFITFPTSVDNWHGKIETIPPETLDALQLSDYWLANYSREADKASVNLYIAYYARQRVGSTIHSPSNCLPGSGWKIADREIISIGTGAQTIPVTRMLTRKDDEALLVYYWFDGRGRIINEQYGAKWYLLVDSITMHRTDGALVRLTTPIINGEDEGAADLRIQEFITKAYPTIRTFIPE